MRVRSTCFVSPPVNLQVTRLGCTALESLLNCDHQFINKLGVLETWSGFFILSRGSIFVIFFKGYQPKLAASNKVPAKHTAKQQAICVAEKNKYILQSPLYCSCGQYFLKSLSTINVSRPIVTPRRYSQCNTAILLQVLF